MGAKREKTHKVRAALSRSKAHSVRPLPNRRGLLYQEVITIPLPPVASK